MLLDIHQCEYGVRRTTENEGYIKGPLYCHLRTCYCIPTLTRNSRIHYTDYWIVK